MHTDSHVKRGFTLIELMIVITISGLLILTGILTFGKSLRQIRLEMFAEDIASTLQYAKNNVASGERVENVSYCRGIALDTSDDGAATYASVQMPYIDGACDMDGFESEQFDFPSGVGLISVVDQNENAYDEGVMIVSVPPQGEFEFMNVSGDPLPSSPALLKFTFAYTTDEVFLERVMSVSKSGTISY